MTNLDARTDPGDRQTLTVHSSTPAVRRTLHRPSSAILYYTGLVLVVVGGLMLVPLLTAVVAADWSGVVDFWLSLALTVGIGLLLMLAGPRRGGDLTWSQGMVAAALAWLAAMVVAALPYYLSGHWASYLDAMFDVMSGLTTTGIVLVQDLDHLSDAINMWRHLLTWLGGQGMVVLALVFLVRGLPGAFKLYVGEAKDERLLPNVIHTARAIWYVSVAYLVVGTVALGVVGWQIGLPWGRAFLHGLWIFMAAWSTGGFAPMSQSIVYYHSLLYEVVTVVFFVIGSFNFNLHWAVWQGNRRELVRNLETVTFLVTTTFLGALGVWGLAADHVYPDAIALFRRGWYSLLSAHTTTGFMSVYAQQFARDWGPLAMLAITLAMLLGGSASSTAGGFKAVRVGLIVKAIAYDVRKLVLPERAVVVEKFHMGRTAVLEDRLARTALSIVVLYVALWFALVLVGAAYAPAFGWRFTDVMFEAASITGNVGLTAGVSSPALPAVMKVAYILGMWLGRLEFLSALVLASVAVRGVMGWVKRLKWR